MHKILVIEDTELIRENIEDILTLNGYDVITAENGKEGVELALGQLPDLILSDIMMPIMDGYEVLETLRSHPETFFIPFVFISAKADRENIREGMSLGADDYLSKPYQNDDLLNTVKIRLSKLSSIKERADKKVHLMKKVISSSLPHEMLTPLNGISGFAQILDNDIESLDKDEIRFMSQNIQKSVKRLNHIIDNYILFNNLTAFGKNYENLRQVKKKYLPLKGIEEVSSALEKEYEGKLIIDVGNDELLLVLNDIFFNKIMFEIIDNALKFGESGIVKIKSKVKDNYYIISVRDEGRGMKESQINSIDAFRQFERKKYEQQGMGLGIYLVKTILKFIEGDFKIESELHKFTEVTIKIPILKI